MSQGNSLDTTVAPADQVKTRAPDDAAVLDAAATELLTERPVMGHAPCPLDAHPDAYALRINGGGAGMFAPPGSAIIVEPIPPAPRDLAVAYFKKGGTPSIWHVGDSFAPEFLNYHPDSEVFPLIELFDPTDGRHGHVDCCSIEKLHRVHSVHIPDEVRQKFGLPPDSLPVFDETPEGCLEHHVRDACNYPVLRTNDVALVDISRTTLEHGALCLIAWGSNRERCGILQTNLRKTGSRGLDPVWWADPVNRPRGPGMLERRQKPGGMLYASDGPYTPEHLQPKIIGTVIGIRSMERRVALGGAA
ncbi:hypothetical protein FPV16_09915 [Methylobacterium sp. W2]|uniref:hypothetical protein n=1 Tax=Methylobacterium sp. W2 TaxID=2598107 RepID=UPI001D0CB3AD|nr:hypothetical protein [Methylobacterium sp. W2]MCC0806531.1 hypothetical protein [Methylobacterium sp. W2]